MFTGIIREIGILQKKEKRDENVTFTIHAPVLISSLKEGSSIAVNGVCLTVEFLFKDAFKVTAIPETLSRTNLSRIHVGSRVNLETALSVGESLDGHLVTGHADAIGQIVFKGPMQNGIVLKIQFPAELKKFFAPKGSVALNGVSLTIIEVQDDTFSVGLIPYTQQNTNLGDIREEDFVNIEVDLVARYLENFIPISQKTL